MIWQPSSKSQTDKSYIKSFQKKLHAGEMKSNDVLPLNESIFAVEGLLNFEKCDATPTRVVDEDYFELTIDIESIDENGIVWVTESELAELYDQIIPNTEVGADEKLSTIDLDVIEISSTSIQVRVSKTVAKQQQALPPPFPFDPSVWYNALGADVIAQNYQTNDCQTGTMPGTGEPYLLPCHIGYPSEPYPSWVYINDALLTYCTSMMNIGVNEPNWSNLEKVWYTNIQSPLDAGTRIHYFSEDGVYDCALGRRDKIYMGGNFRSDLPQNLFWGSTNSCGCSGAPEPGITYASDCGSHLRVPQNADDDQVNGYQMNTYFETVIDHVEERLDYFEAQGLADPGVASMMYYGSQYMLEVNTFGNNNHGVQRSHYCDYRIGTRN